MNNHEKLLHEELLHQYINSNTIKDIEGTREKNYSTYKNTPSLIKLVAATTNEQHHKELKIFYHSNPHKNFNNNNFYSLLQTKCKEGEIYNLLKYCNSKKLYPTYNEWMEYLNYHHHMPLEWFMALKQN